MAQLRQLRHYWRTTKRGREYGRVVFPRSRYYPRSSHAMLRPGVENLTDKIVQNRLMVVRKKRSLRIRLLKQKYGWWK